MRVQATVDRIAVMPEIRIGGNETVKEIEHVTLQHLLFFIQAHEGGRVGREQGDLTFDNSAFFEACLDEYRDIDDLDRCGRAQDNRFAGEEHRQGFRRRPSSVAISGGVGVAHRPPEIANCGLI
jgi:hypothetical protein